MTPLKQSPIFMLGFVFLRSDWSTTLDRTSSSTRKNPTPNATLQFPWKDFRASNNSPDYYSTGDPVFGIHTKFLIFPCSGL